MSLDSPKRTDRLNIGLPNVVGTKSCAKNWSETIDQTIKGCVYCNTVCPVYQNQLHNLYVILRQHLDWRQDSSIVNARHLNNIFSNINYRLIIIRKSLVHPFIRLWTEIMYNPRTTLLPNNLMIEQKGISLEITSPNLKEQMFSNFSCMFLNPNNFFQFEF